MGNIINKISLAVILGFLLLGVFNTAEDTFKTQEDIEDFINRVGGQPINMSKASFLFFYGYMGVTPAITKDWLPGFIHEKGELLFMIEDLPLPDSTDLFIIIPIFLLSVWVLRQFPIFKKKWWLAILIVFIVLLFSWLGLKLLQYHLMLGGAETLGLDKEMVLANRSSLNEGVKNYIPTFIILFLFTSFAIVKIFMGWRKK